MRKEKRKEGIKKESWKVSQNLRLLKHAKINTLATTNSLKVVFISFFLFGLVQQT